MTPFLFSFLYLISLSYSFIPSDTHKFLIFPTTSSFNLDNQEYVFIHIPSTDENYHISFHGIFPIPSYFEIDSLSPFVFRPEVICSNCLLNNHIQVIEGDIYKCSSQSIQFTDKFLSSVFVKITNQVYGKKIEKKPSSEKETIYILLTKISKTEKNKVVLLMKKNYLNIDGFFQVVQATVTIKSKGEFDFEIGEEMAITNGQDPLKNGGAYTSIVQKSEIVEVQYDEISSIICLGKTRYYNSKCSEV